MSEAHIHFNALSTKSYQFDRFKVVFEVKDARHKNYLGLSFVSIWKVFTRLYLMVH